LARALIVGCGCRGRALAGALAQDGHVVRGTSRTPRPAGGEVELVAADPNRLATLVPHLQGVSVVCWLLGSAEGAPDLLAALNGARLQSLLETLVDTPVRGLVYEGAGTVPDELLAEGARMARAAGETYRMPIEVVTADPSHHDAWLEATRAAVGRVLAG
jgi:uncharacterized protein YbjT (DUF2867 family)